MPRPIPAFLFSGPGFQEGLAPLGRGGWGTQAEVGGNHHGALSTKGPRRGQPKLFKILIFMQNAFQFFI